jgi:hypothetical protein
LGGYHLATMALLELIFQDRTVEFTDADWAATEIKRLSADIRLDYHGVISELRITEKLPAGVDICILSFVGRQSQTRVDTRAAIKEWIASGQIKFGALVFKRGTTRPGTKAWFNKLLRLSQRTVGLFVDDSLDHITTTQELCDPWLRVCHLEDPTQLLKELHEF